MKKNDKSEYPSLEEAGIKIPADVNEQSFRDGFKHSLEGKQLTKPHHLKKSFRYGFRTGKLYLKQYMKEYGIFAFPFKTQFKFKNEE